MKIKHIKNHLLIFTTLLFLCPVLTMADNTETSGGGIGYSALTMYFVGDSWRDMPSIYLDSQGSSRDYYREPILMQGIDGYVKLYKNWHLGFNLHSGTFSQNVVLQDTSLTTEHGMTSSGLTFLYNVPIDHSLSVAFASEFGFNSYRVTYTLVNGTHSWDEILDSRKNTMTQNTLESEQQFYTRLKISMSYYFLDKIQFKLSSGLNISPFSQTKWNLNGYVPVAAETDIIIYAPFLSVGVLIGF